MRGHGSRMQPRRPCGTPSALASWLALTLITSCTIAAVTQAQPSGPVRLLVGSPAGGGIDIYARIINEPTSRSLGVPVLVDNRPGANGNIAAQVVADGPADGNLVWVGTQSMLEINPITYESLRWKLADFTPLMKGVEIPLVLTAHPSVPAKTLDELVGWIRSSPTKLGYSSYSAGTVSHFLGFQFAERFGLDLIHVPYRGSAPQTTDLLAGHALFGFAQIPNVAPHVETKQLNAIAVSGATRSRMLPQTPTLAELGYGELTAATWFGLFIRAGAPQRSQERLLAAVTAAHAEPQIRAKLEAQGFDVSGQNGAELRDGIVRQAERWARIVKATGFKAE
jgi:tripartite-type tricarboxylate transporter receptor subunit TctC